MGISSLGSESIFRVRKSWGERDASSYGDDRLLECNNEEESKKGRWNNSSRKERANRPRLHLAIN